MTATNKRARADFDIQDTIEAGIQLTGAEAKSARMGRVDITGSYAKIVGGEVALINASFYNETGDNNRTRKLLLHKRQILNLANKISRERLTLVPMRLYTTKSRLVKVELGVGKTKRKLDRRAEIRRQDLDRELERELKKY